MHLCRHSGFSVSEDLSRKSRVARLELTRFLRHLKRNSPEKNCFLDQDKLYVDGRVFSYSETEAAEQPNIKKTERKINDKS